MLYEPEMVVLSGTVVRFQAYGEPGYGEDPRHDAIERYEALKLDVPICILQQTKDGIDTDEANVRLVQLVFSNPPYSTPAGVHVEISGTVFHAHTGHHHTTVLMTVQQVARRSKPKSE